MERLFDVNDVTDKPVKKECEEGTKDCNIDTKQQCKLIKLAKGIPKGYKQKYLDLFKKYVDVFSWSYDELKTHDISIIQHKIPVKS